MSLDWDSTARPEPVTAAEIYNRALAVKMRLGLLPRRSYVSHVHSMKSLPRPFIEPSKACLELGAQSFDDGLGSSSWTFFDIANAVASVSGLSMAVLRGRLRTNYISAARHVLMYLCASLHGLSLNQTGILLGSRDHTTILHGLQTVKRNFRRYTPLIEAVMDYLIHGNRVIVQLHHPNIMRPGQLAATVKKLAGHEDEIDTLKRYVCWRKKSGGSIAASRHQLYRTEVMT